MAETKINGRTFATRPLSASKAIELYAKVMGFLGPATGRLPVILYGTQQAGDEGRIMTDMALIDALGRIVNEKGADGVRAMAEELISLAEVQRPSGEYGECNLDADFADDPSEAISVILFVAREQFRPFFSGKNSGGLFGMIRTAFQQMK